MAKKILIIEDEEDIRALYAEVLRDEGYEVAEAGDGEKGLSESLTGTYQLILLDLMLPKKDGLEVLKEFRLRKEYAKVPVILLTNLSNEAVIKEGFGLGADSYVIKSEVTPDQMLSEVKKFLPL